MASDYTPKNVTSGYSMEVTINENFNAIKTAMDKALYRSINVDNAMQQDFDMNGFSIFNLPYPGTELEPLRKKELQDFINTTPTSDMSVSALVMLSGVAEGSLDLALFDKDIIRDGATVKEMGQDLEDRLHSTSAVFDTVVNMQAGTLLGGDSVTFALGQILETYTYVDTIHQSWEVVTSVGVNQFGLLLTGGLYAQLVPRESGITPSDFGAGRDEADYGTEIQTAFDYAEDNGVLLTGRGTYFTGIELDLNASFNSTTVMTIEPTVGFVGTDVITVSTASLNIYGLNARNGNAVASLHGIHLKQQQLYLSDCGASNFDKNLIVGSFSITLDKCRGINGGTGLSVYGQSFGDECNALLVLGGEYFNNSDYSMFIGDTRLTSSIPSNEFFGNKIDIIGPTCDQRRIKIDRIIGAKLNVYCEQGGSAETIGIEAGGAFANSIRGLEISGFFTDYDYAVKCFSAISGLNMHDCYYRTIVRSALYLTSEQFSYSYRGNTGVSSFTAGQEVHTGIRSGITTNAWDNATIDIYDLYDGGQNLKGEHIYPSKTVTDGGVQYFYNKPRYRYYENPASATVTVSTNIVTFDTATDCEDFNGGDAVDFTGTGGALTYVLSVDYDAGTLRLESFAFSGAGTLSQETVEPRIEYAGFEASGSTAFSDGSVIWNTYTVDTTTIFWVLKSGVWTAHT